jgi:drug/metabolite transporter (DMT)-like permease
LSQDESVSRQWLPSIAALSAVFFWGAGVPVAKIALEEVDPPAFLFLRVFISAFLLFTALYFFEGNLRVERRDLRTLAVLGIFGIGFTHMGFLFGLDYTLASHSSALVATGPVFATLLVTFIGAEETNRRIWVGIVVCFAGVFLLVGSSLQSIDMQIVLGDAIVLASAVFWAIYAVLSKKMLRIHSPLKVTAYAFAFSNLAIFPVGINAVLTQDWPGLSMRTWGALSFNIVLALVIANILWLQSIKHLGVARTSLFHYLVPVIGIGMSIVLLGENLEGRELMGSAVILIGVVLAAR